jgi:heptosyltransferase-1
MNRILVVRLGSLGDLVHTLPAVSAIRRAYPDATIDWLVDAVHVEFLRLVPVVSTIVPLRERTAHAWLDVRRELRSRRYDVAIDFQGLIKSAALARLSGAARVIGFERAALREGAAAPFYSTRVAVPEGQHVIEKNLSLVQALGIDTTRREFPIAPVDSPALTHLRAQGIGAFALINPGAAWPNKRWPPERFGRVAAWLAEQHALSSVVLWGPGEESLAVSVVDASNGAGVLAPQTTIADLIAVSRAATVMVSGDTGPTHIAAAVGTPVVALFGPTSPDRNGPWCSQDVSLSRYTDCACHYERRCRRESGWCLAEIGEADVRAALDRRLTSVSQAFGS